MTFAFYDLETTGLSPAFDQPLQFAAILTDNAFREIERVNLRCRIAPHIIPSPWALAVTGVRPAQLLDPALPTLFEFTQEIGALIDRWSPAIWTGFNSIRFDEEMLRQAFYQNLRLEVFATQFNGNTRFDLLTALYGVWHRQSDLLDWPVDETGRVRFKLDRIAPLNRFTAHNAHDAMGMSRRLSISRAKLPNAPRRSGQSCWPVATRHMFRPASKPISPWRWSNASAVDFRAPRLAASAAIRPATRTRRHFLTWRRPILPIS